MKYKRQLLGSVLALTIIVSGSAAFAADAPASTTPKAHSFRKQSAMRSEKSDGKVDDKDANGKDIETNDDAVMMGGATSTKPHSNLHKKTSIKHRFDKKVKKGRGAHEEMRASSSKSL